MKRIILSIGLALSLCNATAQNQEKTLDDALVNVNQTTVTVVLSMNVHYN